MIQYEVDIRLREKHQWSALHAACQAGHSDIVDVLLEAGSDANWITADGSTSLYVACYSGHKAVVERLLLAGGRVNAQTADGWTALHACAEKGNAGLAKLILSAGDFDRRLTCKNGDTVLHTAARWGSADVLQILVRARFDLDATNAAGQTPLRMAVRFDHCDVARLLLSAGAKTDVGDDDSEGGGGEDGLLLHVASRHAGPALVRLLLRHGGVAVDATDGAGWTALLRAAAEGRDAVMVELLEKGAAVDAVTPSGDSAVLLATKRNYVDGVRVLIGYNANLNVRDAESMTPLRVALFNQFNDISDLLLKSGADTNL